MPDYVPGTPVSAAGQNGPATLGPTGTFRGNSNQRATVTTSMLSLWDANQNGLKFNVSALDSSLSIAIWIPHVGADGKKSYPKEQRYPAVITQKNCIALEDMIVNHLLVDYENSRNGRYGIFTNAARTTMLEFEVREGEFYATLYIGVDATTKVAQSTIKFKFESAFYHENYDPSTGSFNAIPVQADFYLFLKTLQGFNRMCAGFTAGHGNRHVSGPDFSRLMNYVQAIANAVHAQLPAPSFQTTGGYQQIPGNPTPSVPTPAMTEVSDLSDLLG